MKRISALLAAVLLFFAPLAQIDAFASSPTDEILHYWVMADVNEDATVTLKYHIEWLVLDDDELGPLEWVTVGIPNDMYVDYGALNDTVSSISYDGNNMLRIDLDRKYYEGEVAEFEYYVVSDYMYSMNALQDGQTTYYFTPGWFDGIAIDDLTIGWNNDKLSSWSEGCLINNGYNYWQTSLGPGETYSINVSYPNDAFEFDSSKDWSYSDGYYYDDGSDAIAVILGAIVFFGPQIIIAMIVIRSVKAFRAKSGFTSNDTTKKVTRTKVVYYSECPGCGAPREEGKETCQFCGRNLIKSEEVLEEKTIKDEDKEALKYKTKGEYRYSSNPNTFVRVNVINVPIVTPRPSIRPSSHSGSSVRPGSSSHHRPSGGGCAHSSCACACASCACACACACAGGGRAGCTTKDFYNTKLKLRQLELMNKKR